MGSQRHKFSIKISGGFFKEEHGRIFWWKKVLVPVQSLQVVLGIEELDFFKGLCTRATLDDIGVQLEEGVEGRGAGLLGPNYDQVRQPGTRLVDGPDLW